MQKEIDLKFFAILYITLIIIFCETLYAEEVDETTFCSARKTEDAQCGVHTYKVMKPLLDYFRKVQTKIANHDSIAALQSKAAAMDKTIDLYKKLVDSNNAQIELLNEHVRLLTKTCQSANNELVRIRDQSSEIVKPKTQVDSDQSLNMIGGGANEAHECKKSRKGDCVDSCIPFAKSPGVHEIRVSGYAGTFNVLCDFASYHGAGWMVIQQRIRGHEDFYRDWATYKAGFGSLSGDFFLGLEKIHRLTTSRRFELYIHLTRSNGDYATEIYDHFAIAGEEDQYKLISLGAYSGSHSSISADCMKDQKDNKFYTFDRDNSDGHAKKFHGGWWYGPLTKSNLNGNYFEYKSKNDFSIFWCNTQNLVRVQMLIRPKLD